MALSSLRSLIAVFRRYSRRHLRLSRVGGALPRAQGGDGETGSHGWIEEITLENGFLTLRGHAMAHGLRLEVGGEDATEDAMQGGGEARVEARVEGGVEARVEGGEALVHLPGDHYAPFTLTLPHGPARLVILRRERAEVAFPVAPFSAFAWRRAQLALVPGFLARLVRHLPALWAWARWRDMAARGVLKRALGLDAQLTGLRGERRLDMARLEPHSQRNAPGFKAGARRPGPVEQVAIVMPVHNAQAVTRAALEALARHTAPPETGARHTAPPETGARHTAPPETDARHTAPVSAPARLRVVLVDDGSDEAGMAAMLRSWAETMAGRFDVTLITHHTARGFIGAVNAAFDRLMAVGHGGPVVLLNSDAFVPAGWLPRLLAPLSDPAIASVTPFSNAAEIASAPLICRNVALAPGLAARIDAVAAGLPDEPVIAPTGVGFCMALGARWWRANPRFDPVFGRGYGEEVDWCQRAARRGGQSVIVPNLFVEHRAGASFPSAEKRALLERNGARITARYPGYDAQVQAFIAADPLRSARFALALAWADGLSWTPEPVETFAGAEDHGAGRGTGRGTGRGAEQGTTGRGNASAGGLGADPIPNVSRRGGGNAEPRSDAISRPSPDPRPDPEPRADPSLRPVPLPRAQPVPVYLAHSMGGGAEIWLEGQIRDDLAQIGAALIVRVGGAARFELTLHTEQGHATVTLEEPDALISVVARLSNRRIVYSCGVGDPDPLALPALLLALAGRGAQSTQSTQSASSVSGSRGAAALEVLMHDYFPLDADYTLSGSEALFTGLKQAPDEIVARRPGGVAVTRAQWREAWSGLLARADSIRAFSQASVDLVCAAYPEIGPDLRPARATALKLAPHSLPHEVARVARPARRAPAPARGGGEARVPFTIGVLGNVAPHKGAAVLERLSAHLAAPPEAAYGAAEPRARLVLIGALDPAFHLAPPARIHGPYAPCDIAPLAARYGVDCWFIPATWPETFSYVTHEALATGLPVLAFDLGAQGEALREASGSAMSGSAVSGAAAAGLGGPGVGLSGVGASGVGASGVGMTGARTALLPLCYARQAPEEIVAAARRLAKAPAQRSGRADAPLAASDHAVSDHAGRLDRADCAGRANRDEHPERRQGYHQERHQGRTG